MKKYFSKEHEWISVEDNLATFGITEYAANQLGDIVFIEQNKVGEHFGKGDAIGVIESVKAASDLYAPVSGEIVEVNEELEQFPEQLNASAENEAWIYRLKLSNVSELSELMTNDAYQALINEG